MKVHSRRNSNKRNKKMESQRRYRGKDFAKRDKQIADKFSSIKRVELYSKVYKEVNFNGETTFRGSVKTEPKPILLTDVVVDGTYIEYVWVTIGQEDWAKLAMLPKDRDSYRIYLTGEVHKYMTDKCSTEKIGIRKARLIHE